MWRLSFGIVTEVSSFSVNAYASISSIVFGIVTEVSLLRPKVPERITSLNGTPRFGIVTDVSWLL